MDTKKSFLVTGGAGFIGSHVVDALIASGAKVTVVDVKAEAEAKNIAHQTGKIIYVQGNICNESLVDDLCQGKDYIIHLAAVVSVPLSIEKPVFSHNTNVNGTLNVFNSAEKNGVKKVVYASSAAVYGNSDKLPVAEDFPLSPLSPYAIHKVNNEMYGKYYSERGRLETVGLRYFNVFGLRQDPGSPYSGVVSLLLDHYIKGSKPTIFGTGEQTRDFVSVKDVALANLLAVENGKSGSVYNIASGKETSINDLVGVIEKISNSPFLTLKAPARDGDIKRSCATIDRAKRELNFEPLFSLATELENLLVGNKPVA